MPRLKNLRLIFTISLILKGVFALFETLGGILAYFVSQQALLKFVNTITGGELVEDPQDIVANFLRQSAQHLSEPDENSTLTPTTCGGHFRLVWCGRLNG